MPPVLAHVLPLTGSDLRTRLQPAAGAGQPDGCDRLGLIFIYQPVCELHREQFADEYGWRVRDVRVCP